AFNLGLVMRKVLGHGTPRGLQGYPAALFLALLRLWCEFGAPIRACGEYADSGAPLELSISQPTTSIAALLTAANHTVSTTGCYSIGRDAIDVHHLGPLEGPVLLIDPYIDDITDICVCLIYHKVGETIAIQVSVGKIF